MGINKPYEGTLVPMAFYKKDRQVESIMIEVNRSLYMDEMTGTKRDSFESIKKHIWTLLYSINKFQQGAPLTHTQQRGQPLTRDKCINKVGSSLKKLAISIAECRLRIAECKAKTIATRKAQRASILRPALLDYGGQVAHSVNNKPVIRSLGY